MTTSEGLESGIEAFKKFALKLASKTEALNKQASALDKFCVDEGIFVRLSLENGPSGTIALILYIYTPTGGHTSIIATIDMTTLTFDFVKQPDSFPYPLKGKYCPVTFSGSSAFSSNAKPEALEGQTLKTLAELLKG